MFMHNKQTLAYYSKHLPDFFQELEEKQHEILQIKTALKTVEKEKKILKMEMRTGMKTIMKISDLSIREKQVLEMRFGLINGKTYTLEDVGRKLGATRERVRQVETKAMEKLIHNYNQ